jgi:hypothetical protein
MGPVGLVVGLRTRIPEGIEKFLEKVEWLQPDIEQRE